MSWRFGSQVGVGLLGAFVVYAIIAIAKCGSLVGWWDSQVWQIVQALATWLLAIGIVFAFLQVQQARKSTNAQLAVQLFRELRSENSKKTLRLIYRLRSDDVKHLSSPSTNVGIDNLKHEVDGLLDKFEMIGGLVNQGVLDKSLAIEVFAGPPALRCWYQLVEYIRQEQRNRGFFLKNYEIFTRSTLQHFYDEKVEIWLTLEGDNKIPLVKELIGLRNRGDVACPRSLDEINEQRDC